MVTILEHCLAGGCGTATANVTRTISTVRCDQDSALCMCFSGCPSCRECLKVLIAPTFVSTTVGLFPAKDCYMIASTVSSKMLRSMATVEGFNFEETLTGFKWIANRADGLKKAGKRMLFAFEEAIGFMCGDMVMDKDGISACMVAAEMIGWLVSQKLSVVEHLEYLHKKYCHQYFLTLLLCDERSAYLQVWTSCFGKFLLHVSSSTINYIHL